MRYLALFYNYALYINVTNIFNISTGYSNKNSVEMEQRETLTQTSGIELGSKTDSMMQRQLTFNKRPKNTKWSKEISLINGEGKTEQTLKIND